MENFKIKCLRKLGDLSICIVDGSKIRKEVDPDFVNFGQHFKFKFIPINELWIDKGESKSEYDFYIKHLLVERNLMSKGISYAKAIDVADRAEAAERHKSKKYKELINGVKNKTDEVKINDILTIGDVNIFLVDGEIVRDLFFIDFTEGGNYKAYDFIPKKEIWIEKSLDKLERECTIVHEYIEMKLMESGMSYYKAHRYALKIEWMMRKAGGNE